MKKFLKILGIVVLAIFLLYVLFNIVIVLIYRQDMKFKEAAAANDIPAMEQMIAEGYDVQRTVLGKKHLQLYLEEKTGTLNYDKIDAQTVKFLLEEGISPNNQEKGKASPLHLAIFANRPDIVELLLYSGADANYRALYDLTALDLALSYKKFDLVPVIEKFGGKLNRFADDERYLLMLECLHNEECKARLDVQFPAEEIKE